MDGSEEGNGEGEGEGERGVGVWTAAFNANAVFELRQKLAWHEMVKGEYKSWSERRDPHATDRHSHRGTGAGGTGSAAGQHSTGGCGSSAARRCGSAAAHGAGWGAAAWPLLHCCSRPPTPLLALQLALQQPIPPPLSSSADSSARQQLPARPAAAMLARALILPQRRYAGFYCCYHCCQLSYSLCRDRPCHANWPPDSPVPVSAPTPTRFLNSVGYFSRATLSRLRRQAQLIPLAALPTSA